MSARIASFARRNGIALVALFFAIGGGSAVAASYINGSKIKPNSIPENRLTSAAIGDLRALGASAYSDDATATPPPGGTQSVIKQVQITTTHTGSLLVLGSVLESATFNNTSNTPVHYSLGIYVDGIPVPGTFIADYLVPPTSSGSFNPSEPLYGLLPNVPAGTHTVAIAAQTTDTAVDYITGGTGRLIVVATD
jgi:hypothetical protein